LVCVTNPDIDKGKPAPDLFTALAWYIAMKRTAVSEPQYAAKQ